MTDATSSQPRTCLADYSEGSAQAFREIGDAMRTGAANWRLVRTLLQAAIDTNAHRCQWGMEALLQAAMDHAERKCIGLYGAEPRDGAVQEAIDCIKALDVGASPVARVWRRDTPEMFGEIGRDDAETSLDLLVRLRDGTRHIGRLVVEWEGWDDSGKRIGEYTHWQLDDTTDDIEPREVDCWAAIPGLDAVMQGGS